MRPYEKLKTIYEIASRMIVRGEGAWKDYLSFAARIHKYSFDNALLVYAQNPDVTALASITQWNKVGRNVNKGSKGIAVCDYENAKLSLSYLFDISQTNGRQIRFLDWQLDDDMKSEIAKRLIRADDLSATDFSETVTALASKRVNDNYENCLRSIMANSQDHIFSELPEGGLEAQLISLLTDSTAYFVGKRCGLADDEIMLEGGMSTISDFNRIPLIATLGNTVTNCAKEILIEMELTIKTINAERTANNERKQSEYQLHREERNIVPESASIQRADSRSAVGQIRQNGDGVPERKPSQPLYSFENGWHSDGSDAHGSADSHRENRGNDTGNAGKRADARHREHDGEDTALEQPETVSRGSGNQRVGTDSEIKAENAVVTEPPKDGSVFVSGENPKSKMTDEEIIKHYETILMSTDIYPIEMHRRLYLVLKDEPNNNDWQSVSDQVYSIFAEYGNREYQGEVLYRTELVNKDGISMFFGDGSTYLPWIFVANIINAMIVDGVYPGDFTQLFDEARKILEPTPIKVCVVSVLVGMPQILQSSDNNYYLRRMIDKKYNIAGSVFMDYRCQADLSSLNTIIYGHNMKNDTMFGTFTEYKKQSYYDEHPVLWLLTPEQDYKIELIAGYVTPSTSDVYKDFYSKDELDTHIKDSIDKSTFVSDVNIAEVDNIVTLSTCSYEYSTARYVLIGNIKENN